MAFFLHFLNFLSYFLIFHFSFDQIFRGGARHSVSLNVELFFLSFHTRPEWKWIDFVPTLLPIKVFWDKVGQKTSILFIAIRRTKEKVAHTFTHIYTQTHTRSHKHTHVHTHLHTFTHTHTHTTVTGIYTHTRTQTQQERESKREKFLMWNSRIRYKNPLFWKSFSQMSTFTFQCKNMKRGRESSLNARLVLSSSNSFFFFSMQ